MNYARLTINLKEELVKGSWLDIKANLVKDSLRIRDVDWSSLARREGVRRNQVLTSINGKSASLKALTEIEQTSKANDLITIEVLDKAKKTIILLLLSTKKEASFEIKRQAKPNALQSIILKSWLKEE